MEEGFLPRHQRREKHWTSLDISKYLTPPLITKYDARVTLLYRYVLKWMKGKDNLQSERTELDIQLQDRILPSDQFRNQGGYLFGIEKVISTETKKKNGKSHY